ncbi:hypothetical protein BDA99DRAFT_524612 [Phascolomyces articulosus]|uniref:Histone-lysine N-methyltransferase n=1 Tax=Phascolomyces articulosus TaxID=60185 RepID=A0AAD5P9A3_9FUNG|nr:hypothetical protein BDA99DRAFT_524612 [Phascolomyces articulosus]
MALNENEYYVKRIAGQKFFRMRRCYLIEWADYAPEDSTWEEESCLLGDTELVKEFQKQLMKEFPDRPNLLYTHDRVLLPDAYDPERQVSKSPEAPLAPKTNSNSNYKRPATYDLKNNSPRKASRTLESLEYEFRIPEKLKRKWRTIKRDFDEKSVNDFLRTLNNSVIKAQKYSCKLVQTSKTQSHFEGAYPPVEVINSVDGEPFPKDFVYIHSLVFGKNISRPDPSFLTQCECSGTNCSGLCHDNGSLVYSNDGRIKVPPGTAIFECNKGCGCSKECPNRVVQRGRQIPLQIYKTKAKGWGVKATQDIPKGAFVEEYLGEVIHNKMGNRRGKFYDVAGTTYLFDMDFGGAAQYVIDSFLLGNSSHFFNHSCSPNLTVYAVYSDSADTNFHRLAFFSNRFIRKGQELTVDYEGTNVEEYTDTEASKSKVIKGTFKCHCASSQCRKYIHH